jgi:excinuclease ABC subunit B
MFNLSSIYTPQGDQPRAIQQIIDSFDAGDPTITLLWATGTGKTFTMANIINHLQKPTLIISHNKTLAAQLATEFKYFFPDNAVHYFVSYFDYYQPESYLPDKDIYIEKEATINKEIEMYRLATMASLLSRKDVIVVCSVSSLYGLWSQESFAHYSAIFKIGEHYNHKQIKAKLLSMQYKPVQGKIESGMFDFKWHMCDIFASTEKYVYRLFFDEEELVMIQKKDSLTFEVIHNVDQVVIWPKSQYMQDMTWINQILIDVQRELQLRYDDLMKQGKQMEAVRLQKKVMYDVRMIQETWFTNGIENYSRRFDGRKPWEPPNTIFDYFPDDMLCIVDESHVTIGQLNGMPAADRSRKINLIEYGFRLPSAIDHRPINFTELQTMLKWDTIVKDDDAKKLYLDLWMDINQELGSTDNISHTTTKQWMISKAKKNKTRIIPEYLKPSTDADVLQQSLSKKIKHKWHTLFVSATPADREIQHSSKVVEQIIRPTWLLDPITYIYPKSWDYKTVIDSFQKVQLQQKE